MNTNPSGNQFTVPERFRLAIAAMARDDSSEARELRRTCPDSDPVEIANLMAALRRFLSRLHSCGSMPIGAARPIAADYRCSFRASTRIRTD